MQIKLSYKNDRAMMRIEGFVNSDNAALMQEKLDEVLRSDARYLDLDLYDCKNISSIGIGKLLVFYKNFIGKGGDIEVLRSSTTVYELFKMLKLNQLFTVNLE